MWQRVVLLGVPTIASLPVLLVPGLDGYWWLIAIVAWLLSCFAWGLATSVRMLLGTIRGPIDAGVETSGQTREKSTPSWRSGAGVALVIAFVFIVVAASHLGLAAWVISFGVWITAAAAWIVTIRDDPGQDERPICDKINPGWISNFAVLLLVLFSCSAISAPGSYEDRLLVAVLLWFIVGLVWFGRLIALLVVTRGRIWTIRRMTWLVQPALVVIMAVLGATDAPRWGAFRLSKGEMTREARAVLVGESPKAIERLGAYRVSEAERSKAGFRFTVSGSGGFTCQTYGFAYMPDGPPRTLEEDVYTGDTYDHWSGAWYVWTHEIESCSD